MNKYTIWIIGWTWRFWGFWKSYFEDKWNQVLVSSRSSELSHKELIEKSDIIIFSLSIRNTKEVIKSLIPEIPAWKLVMDFTWIKGETIEEMSKYSLWEVVWTHPMFWPNVRWLQKQNIAFDPVNPWEKWQYIYNLWKEDGANLIQMTSKRHDELVWLIQPMTHFVNFLFWHMLKERWIHPEELVPISTPVSRMQAYIFSRFLWQQSGLYADMQICNITYKKEILKELVYFAEYLKSVIEQDDFDAFEKEFEWLKSFIWDGFLEKAMKVSTKIDEIVKED